MTDTERLTIREFTLDDDEFIIRLLNSPGWLRFIGDRNITTRDDAHHYLINGPIHSYHKNGFGLMLVQLKDSHVPIGMCGLIKRDGLEDVDIGFAFLPEYAKKGFAFEAASAILSYANNELAIHRIVAIVTEDNLNSIALLKKLNLSFEKMFLFPGEDKELMLFATTR